MKEQVVTTKKPEETYLLGRLFGECAFSGEIICLSGDLGTGKTVFAKGFAEGLGVKETVNSPTFTILQIYEDGRIPFYHFDVYRIEDPEEMEEIGYEEFFYGEGVCLVEWSDNIRELIPQDAVRITIRADAEEGFDFREMTVCCSEQTLKKMEGGEEEAR